MFAGIQEFRRRLTTGRVLVGGGIGLTDCQVSDALAGDLDSLRIHLEHAAMSPDAMVADCRYPPQGRRRFGPHVPGDYGRDGGPLPEETCRLIREAAARVGVELDL